MEKRSCIRIEAVKMVRIYYRAKMYPGTTLNISEKGIFIDIKRWFSTNIMCGIDIHIEDEFLKMLVMVKHFTKVNGSCYGLGVEIINSPMNYLEFVKNLKRTSDFLL